MGGQNICLFIKSSGVLLGGGRGEGENAGEGRVAA
jgi:hypothetical protein